MRDPRQAWEMLHNADVVCSAAEVRNAIRNLAAAISDDLAEKYPLVLCVMGGAVFFAGQILPLLHFPLDFDYIHVTRYGDVTVGTKVDWRVAPPESVRGRTVLVLDDILDGGHTMAAIRDRIFRPFFTTRAAGTGLGLAIVQKIVVTHNGRIALRAAVRGASFEITLPLATS